MSLKLKALLILLGGISAAIAGGFALDYIVTNVSIETIKNALSVMVIGVLCYSVYGLILGHLEYDQKMNEINEKYKKTDEK